MPLRDLLLMAWVCLSLASSAIVARLVVTTLDVPPLMFTAARSAVVLLCTFPWLLPMPRPYLRFLATAMLFGLGGFTLFFLGLRSAQPSSAAIVNQLSIPFTTIMAVALLGERIGPRKIAGTTLAIAGILTVMWRPGGFGLSEGLVWVAVSAMASSGAVIMLKRITTLEPLRLQAWVGASALVSSAILTNLLDDRPWQRAWHAGWPLLAAACYSAIIVSLLAQGINYRLLHRHDANVTAPLMVMAPLFTMVLGPLLTGDVITPRLLTGAAIAIAGVIVVVRAPAPTKSVPDPLFAEAG